MRLESLCVAHLPVASDVNAFAFPEELEAFALGTCQRKLWVFEAESASTVLPTEVLGQVEVYQGLSAYRFLLRFAAGLESEVLGETDVFGQFKEAWKAHLAKGTESAVLLGPWVQKIFEDTKEIRSQYLQHVGGDSYGSLVRKLLRPSSIVDAQAPLLIVGAGQIAKSVAPWLSQQEIWLLNRSAETLARLRAEILDKNPLAKIRVVGEGDLSEERAWREAAHAVVCIPALGTEQESQWMKWFEEGSAASSQARLIVHLGGIRDKIGAWADLAHCHSLDEVFALQRLNNSSRSELFARAFRACDEKSRLRSLPGSPGGSASLPHGWEDLAVFAESR
jgi:glutamyl-tRNA reductase